MGNCPCCPKRGGTYNPYVEEDDDYREYDSPNSRGYKKPLVPSSTNTQTNYFHSDRPPDESTYSPPPLPPSRGTTITAQDAPPRNTPPTSTTPPHHPQASPPPSTTTQQTQQTQQQQYTQYSESLYLARQPEQPTDSMLLDSMMKSSFMDRREQRFSANSQAPPGANSMYGTESASVAFDGGSSLVDSNFAGSTSQHPDFAASTQQSPDFAASTSQHPDMAESNASLVTSTSSSVYYDAQGATSYMMGSVNEGAFEPPQQ